VETDANTTTRETKEQMGKWYNKWHEETKNKELIYYFQLDTQIACSFTQITLK
jgi:hypothetical protein